MSKPVATNRKASWRYEILEKHEAGLVLKGAEVKSIRAGHVDLSGTFVQIRKGEAYVVGMKITKYVFDSSGKLEGDRRRKLLLKRSEIDKLSVKVSELGLSLVALSVYFNNKGYAKLSVGLGRGKKEFDKKKTKTLRTVKREMDRQAKEFGSRYRS